jgi:type IV pilus assembly protein PilF
MTPVNAYPTPSQGLPSWAAGVLAIAARALMPGVLVAGLCGLGGLSGCATNNSATDSAGNTGTRSDIVTESDEPETRRRARIRLELASGYFAEGKSTVALDEIKQAIASDPTYGDAFNLRGLIYMRLNDLRLAEDSFRRAIALNPRDANAAHNFGWMLCQQQRFSESQTYFKQALTVPLYADQAKTLMTHGMCQIAAGNKSEAERSLARSYELDAGNPITGYNLALLLYERAEITRAQFYIRRLNNTEYANPETLWLGIKVERKLNDNVAMQQLVGQLKRRFPQSRELVAYERGAFNE